MQLTVLEASVKKCPNKLKHGGNCIGMECMAWRWYFYVQRHVEKGPMDNSGGGRATGYCGLAGRPEC
jgi:hypothetical protein